MEIGVPAKQPSIATLLKWLQEVQGMGIRGKRHDFVYLLSTILVTGALTISQFYGDDYILPMYCTTMKLNRDALASSCKAMYQLAKAKADKFLKAQLLLLQVAKEGVQKYLKDLTSGIAGIFLKIFSYFFLIQMASNGVLASWNLEAYSLHYIHYSVSWSLFFVNIQTDTENLQRPYKRILF